MLSGRGGILVSTSLPVTAAETEAMPIGVAGEVVSATTLRARLEGYELTFRVPALI